MFSHITVGVSDLDAAAAFYDAILLPLGLQRREVTPDGGPAARCWVMPGQTLPRFYAYQPFDRQPANACDAVTGLAPAPRSASRTWT